MIALAGNKADMRDKRQVEAEVRVLRDYPLTPSVSERDSEAPQEASAYAAANGILYLDTSAKTGLGVKDLFAGIGAPLLLPDAAGTSPPGRQSRPRLPPCRSEATSPQCQASGCRRRYGRPVGARQAKGGRRRLGQWGRRVLQVMWGPALPSR